MKEVDVINILCSTDDNYVPQTGIMLTSLFENNPGESFHVYILTRGIQEDAINKLKRVGQEHHSEIDIITVSLSMFADCPIRPGDHVTLETYFRLLAPRLLPEHIFRILYLDVDIIINGPVRKLWEWDIDNYAIGAIVDESFCNQEIYSRLQLDTKNPYFNAGVLLLNLDYWRENEVSARCMQCIQDNPDILLFHDQDTLNRVLANERVLLPITYNFQTGYMLSWIYPDYPEDFQALVQKTAKERPIIIHFSGPMKPWFVGNDHPYRYYFRHYRSISFWQDFQLIGEVSLPTQIKLAFGRFAKSIGLMPWKFAVKTVHRI